MLMGNSRDRILIVEHDPVISDLIARQALQPLGYQVSVIADGSVALRQAIQFDPDTIIIDMNLPGLSGKDMLVALSSQGIQVPIIIIAHQKADAEIIQAFRLGASDYMLWPARDAEVVSVIERVLKQVHERHDKEHLARQLQQSNQELQNRVRELTTIFSIGKAVTSITDQRVLFERIMDGAVRVTSADLGWFLLRDGEGKTFYLAAQRKLPSTLASRIGQVWDDGISSLVAASGETLSIFGEPFKRFKIASLGQAALTVPVKVQKQTIGLITVIRQAAKPFTPSEQSLLEAATDYASISMVNARLFRALEERARSLQQAAEAAQDADKSKSDLMRAINKDLRDPLDSARSYIDALIQGKKGPVPPEQQQLLLAAQEKMLQIGKVAAKLGGPTSPTVRQLGFVNLNDLSRQALARFHRPAQQNGLTLVSELASPPVTAWGDTAQVAEILDGLLSNAVKFSKPGGQITLRTDRGTDDMPHVVVRDRGIGIDNGDLKKIFDSNGCKQTPIAQLGGKPAIGLHEIKDVITSYGGKVWVESKPGQGSSFHLTLQQPQDR
jgi:signal transduction histidine kinase/DNA-binding response OmpR family regulator